MLHRPTSPAGPGVVFSMIFGMALGAVLIAAPAAANPALDRAYGPEARHRLDVYAPADAGRTPRKVIVYFHGGAWKYGSKDRYAFVGRALAARGYVAVVPNYRLYPQVTFPAFMYDAGRVLAWVRAHAAKFGGDPRQVWLMGHSAGAHIALLLALDPRYAAAAGLPAAAARRAVAGVIGLAGPYRFQPSRLRFLQDVFGSHPKPAEALPITFARNTGPRLLLLSGALDRLIRPAQARDMAQAYRRAGGAARVRIYPSHNHISIVLALNSDTGDVWRDIRTFVGAPKP